MVNRVALGQKSAGAGVFGLWISKPGKDVLTITTDADHLFRTDFRGAQIIQTGKILMPGNFVPTNITLPTLGFRPFITFDSNGNDGVIFRYLSDTEIRFEKATSGGWSAGPINSNSYGASNDRYILYKVWSMVAT